VRVDGGRAPAARYVVAHELRTPLTSVVVGTRLLLDNSIKAGRRREIAHDVAAEAQRLANAVEDLLVLAGFEGAAVQGDPVSLQASVHVELAMACRLAPDLTVRTLLARDVPPVVADAGRVEHLVRNLVAGAAVAAGENGQLEVAVVRAPAGGVSIRVAGRPRRRDGAAAAHRAGAAPLRDVATRIIAERLGGRLSRAFDRGAQRASVVLPVGDTSIDDGPKADGPE
jgi:nitrogen-specific signal transduction histidine kinase